MCIWAELPIFCKNIDPCQYILILVIYEPKLSYARGQEGKIDFPMQRKDLWDQWASHGDLTEKVLENFVTASV